MALGGFAIGALAINERATQTAVTMFGLHGFYAPWQWIVWWARWHTALAFQPVWETCTRLVLMPMLTLAGIAGETIVHCPVCHDKGMVTVEQADRGRRRLQELYGSK
jgi:hypothetical protein